MASPAGTPIQGRYGRFQVNGVTANVERFNGNIETDIVPATGFEDQDAASGRTVEVVTDGLDRMTATIEGYVDASAVPYSFSFTQGSILSNVKLVLTKLVAARCITASRCIVRKINYQVNVKDVIKFSLDIQTSGGTLTHPTA